METVKKLSIIIPSAKDPCLQRTIYDLKMKARGSIEIIVVLDGNFEIVYNADKVIQNEKRMGMRYSVNKGVEASTGDYIMKIDSHCMVGEHYDEILLKNIEDNWVVVPRRYKLDIDSWRRMDEEGYVDYDRLLIDRPDKITGVHWNSRRDERKHIPLDETMVMQGSCYVMSRKHWDWLGGLQEEGYGSLMQEAEEVALKTWLGGGKVMVNKETWYAHKHRKFRRTVHIDSEETLKCYAYSKDFWLNDRWGGRIHDLKWLMERFGRRWNPAL